MQFPHATLMAFKIIERLFAFVTLVKGFTGCGSELAYHFCMPGITLRALNSLIFLEPPDIANSVRRIRRGNAISF